MIHKIERTQLLPISMEQAWDYFIRPENLNELTPPDFHFEIKSSLPEKVYPGLLIAYSIKPFAGIPFSWVTEITHVQEHKYFIDEQRFGPYKLWHHEHHFTHTPEGVLMKDLIWYDVGKGIIGNIAHRLIVRQRLEQIFDYRFKKLKSIFA